MAAREAIYNHFHSSLGVQAYFFDVSRADEYAAYYTSMYLLQDTSEALWTHRRRGFSSRSLDAYIEFWGVMQAIAIQQDAVLELHLTIAGARLNTRSLTAWSVLREKRVVCAGHPAGRRHHVPAPQRSFMGRSFGDYSSIRYELWDANTRSSSYPSFRLGDLLDKYDSEVEGILLTLLRVMTIRWP